MLSQENAYLIIMYGLNHVYCVKKKKSKKWHVQWTIVRSYDRQKIMLLLKMHNDPILTISGDALHEMTSWPQSDRKQQTAPSSMYFYSNCLMKILRFRKFDGNFII